MSFSIGPIIHTSIISFHFVPSSKTQLHIDTVHDQANSADSKKELDFFAECENFDNAVSSEAADSIAEARRDARNNNSSTTPDEGNVSSACPEDPHSWSNDGNARSKFSVFLVLHLAFLRILCRCISPFAVDLEPTHKEIVFTLLLPQIPKLASLGATVDPTAGPRVDFLNSEIPMEAPKSTIGVRKIQPKKAGLGARKGGGLGATRVKTNFAEIEERANMADKLKLAASSTPAAAEKVQSEEEKAETLASVRLAYQDLSIKQHREEEKLKAIDPNKAKQMERLGMGFGRAGGVSHSVLTDMKTITQEETTRSGATVSKAYDRDDSSVGGGSRNTDGGGGSSNNDFFDDYSIIYGISGSGSKSGNDLTEANQLGYDTLEPIDSKRPAVRSMFSAQPANSGFKSGSSISGKDCLA